MMSRCRVYTMPDGSVRIVHPAPESRLPDEPEADWYARVMARTEAANPSLQGRPFLDSDTADLPADRTQRATWRVRSGRVQG
jgi:hypothetical protein